MSTLDFVPTPFTDLDAANTEIDRLRRDCFEAYQIVGIEMLHEDADSNHPRVEDLLDNLLSASSGVPRTHEDLLPWEPKAG